jgi:hypothetical protein
MIKRIRRVTILLASMAGLLVLSEQAAHAFISYNHCEPLR